MSVVTREQAVARARGVFESAADAYDAAPSSYRHELGRELADRANLAPGMRVLDAAAGSGASAIPAAMRVGRGGAVLAVDLSGRMLALASAKAARLGIDCLTCRVGDFLLLPPDECDFDAVLCGFGIFLVHDMAAATRSLMSRMRPGGTLALSTWGPRLFEPATEIFWNAVRSERPDLFKGYDLWDALDSPAKLEAMLRQAGVETPEIQVLARAHGIESGEDWWTMLMGSGARGIIDQLEGDVRDRVKAQVIADVNARGVRTLELNVLFALARRPEGA